MSSVDEPVRNFADPAGAERPKFRWWWPGGAVDDAELARELGQMRDAGYGGAELAVLPIGLDGDRGPEQGRWGTPEFQAHVRAALEAARDAGQRLDFTIGPGWPMVSPAVGGDRHELAMHELAYGTRRLAGGETFDDAVPPPDGRRGEHEALVAVTAARLAGAEGERPLLLDPASLLDLSAEVTDGRIAWTAPAEGEWILFAYWSRPTPQRTIAGVTTGDAPVVDHFSEAAVKAATDFIDEHVLPHELDELLGVAAGDIFEDSLELDADHFWTAALLDEFRARRGYDLTPYLPVTFVEDLHHFVAGGIRGITPESPSDFDFPDGSGRRVRHDYYRTLTELYVERHTLPLQRWANGRGLRYRAQPYGSTLDPLELAAHIEVPECENLVPLWFSGGRVDGAAEYNTYIDFVRGISAGAHMQGRDVVSLEGCAFLDGDYVSPLAEKKRHVDIAFAGGVTQLVSHGFAYADVPGQPWPGWSPFSIEGYYFGVSEVWGPIQPMWRHFRAFGDYVGRAATVLRHGAPRVDVAVFRQQYWSHSWPKISATSLSEHGYTYAVLSTAMLNDPAATVEGGRLAPARAGYRALIVDERAILPEALERIKALVEAGLPLVFVGELPSATPGFKDAAAQDAAVRRMAEELAALPHVRRAATQDDVAAALRDLGVEPDASPSEPVTVYAVHRHAPEGDYWFLLNHGPAAQTFELSLLGSGDARVLDLWDGSSHPLPARADGERTTVELTLAAAETTVVFVGRGTGLDARDGAPVVRRGAPERWSRELSDWQLEVEDWTPAGVKRRALALPALRDWTELPELAEASGVGTYRATVELEAGWDADATAVLLDLGRVEGTIAVTVNGQPAAGDCVAVRPLPVTALLREGANEVVVEVATTLGNRVSAHARELEGQRAQRLAAREPRPAGLLGPVRLIAVSDAEASSASA